MATQIAIRLKDLSFQLVPGGDRLAADRDHGGNARRSSIDRWTVCLYVFASSVAVLSVAGGVALMFGATDLRFEAGQALHGVSPVVVGLALVAVLGVPMASASVALYRMTRHAGRVAVGAGLVLMALIAVDAFVVGEFTWVYIPLGAIGLTMFMGGTHLRRLVHLGRVHPAVTTIDVPGGPPPVQLSDPTERERERWASDGGRSTDDPRWAADLADTERARRKLSGPAAEPATAAKPTP